MSTTSSNGRALDARIRKVAQREGISYAQAFERVCDGDPGQRRA
jgi:hypothetical protein